MKTRIIISTFLIYSLSISAWGQDASNKESNFAKRNSLQVEALGNGFYLFSLNYERIILNGNRFKTAGQIGFGGIGSDEINIPVVINEIFSFNDNHLETGFGIVLSGTNSYALTGRLGYRYQKPDSHFVFRIGCTPIIGIEENGNSTTITRKLYVWGGLAMGYCF